MEHGRIIAIHIGLIRKPRCFVVQRTNPSGRDTYEVFKPRSLRKFVIDLLSVLTTSRPDFMHQLAELDERQRTKSSHKTRRYIAEDRIDVYVSNAGMATKYSEQFEDYWIATNIGPKETRAISGLACDAANVRFDSVYSLRLP